MSKNCPQLKTKLQELKSLYSDYSLELEKVKNSKEYELALNIQQNLTQAIVEIGVVVNPEKYNETCFTEIERKNKANIPLTKAEIIFLYNIYNKFENYIQDMYLRIHTILRARNPKEDAPIVFDCEPSEIAYSQKEITANTKAYIGHWDIDTFQAIRNYPNITHLYESFPDKKIFMQTLETDPSINSPAKAEQVLEDKNIYLSNWAKYILGKTEFSQTPEVYNLVRFTVEQLGLKQGVTIDEIYKRARELSLEQCPAEVGPQLRLKYTGRELFLIAMKQISDRSGNPRVFNLGSHGARLLLDGYYAGPDSGWGAGAGFVFRFRREDKKE